MKSIVCQDGLSAIALPNTEKVILSIDKSQDPKHLGKFGFLLSIGGNGMAFYLHSEDAREVMRSIMEFLARKDGGILYLRRDV